MAETERTTLYSPDGRPYSTASPTEITRLKFSGYTTTPPEQLVVTDAEQLAPVVFDPAEHTVDQVHEFLKEHPELAESVVAAERQGKNRSSIVAG